LTAAERLLWIEVKKLRDLRVPFARVESHRVLQPKGNLLESINFSCFSARYHPMLEINFARQAIEVDSSVLS
jgi:hypothetical protein